MTSLLGQQTERPQSLFMLGTTITIRPEDRRDTEYYTGRALVPLFYPTAFAEVHKSSCPVQVESTFASLKGHVPNPFEEFGPSGWIARICTGGTPESEMALAFGGPDERKGPPPELLLKFRESSNLLYLSLHSRLRKPLSSALLYQGLKVGETALQLGLNTRGLNAEALSALFNRCRRSFLGGEQWTLISGQSGTCARATIDRPVTEFDEKKQVVRVIWRVKDSNHLTPCPANLFFDLSELNK